MVVTIAGVDITGWAIRLDREKEIYHSYDFEGGSHKPHRIVLCTGERISDSSRELYRVYSSYPADLLRPSCKQIGLMQELSE